MLETIKFIKENENWRELLASEPYCLSIKEDEHFALLKYNQVESDFNEPIVKECRGLIIDLQTIEPVALSFKKFHNVQEPLADRIYWKECRVQEKVDGSKILVWYDKYQLGWRISTSGMLNAKDALVNDFGVTYEDLFDKALSTLGLTREGFTNLLDGNFCYTFELVSPESRVVVPYKETKIYFIGLRYTPTFIECNPDSAEHICKVIPRPKEYKLDNLNACLHATEKMGFDEEGFVVVDKYWNRVKIKSPAYVAAHHLRDNGAVNRDKILTILEQGEKEEFLGYFPEYKEYFDDIETKRNKFMDKLLKAVEDLDSKMFIYNGSGDTETWERKDFAKYIMSNYKDLSAFLFKFMDTDLFKMFVETQWNKLTQDKKLDFLDKVED